MTDKVESEELEWDADSPAGEEQPEQELPEYFPTAFDTETAEEKEVE